jgi:hypothetical protein
MSTRSFLRLDGSNYQVIEAQSENKTEEKTYCIQTCSPNSYKEHLRVEVLKMLCVIVPVTLWSVISILDPPGDCPINWFMNPENTLITYRIIRIRDIKKNWKSLCKNKWVHGLKHLESPSPISHLPNSCAYQWAGHQLFLPGFVVVFLRVFRQKSRQYIDWAMTISSHIVSCLFFMDHLIIRRFIF